MKRKRETLTEQIRRAADESGLSQNELARVTGLDVAAVNRFIRQGRALSLQTLDVLADALDLSICKGKPPKGRKGQR